MRLDGIHHVTCITGDAPQNVEYYAHTLGLRMVKKTVNQDDPTVYHLFYADEHGSPGADITFFEYPGLPRGLAGHGMVHRIVFRVGSDDALDFWEARVGGTRGEGSLVFEDPEGLSLELAVDSSHDDPLVASHPEIRARGGAGTVHHVAWSAPTDDHAAWVKRVAEAGGHPTPVIDRFWFRSIYFREPSGVLFEIASLGPGFQIDEDPDHLGEKLILPPAYEHLRAEIEPRLTPLPNPRELV